MRRIDNQVARVYGLHKQNRIKVFNDLREYLDQKMSFSYVLDEKYQPTDKYEDEPRYHLMAAERYILSYFRPETAISRVNVVRVTRG
jgi:hypothetical protein